MTSFESLTLEVSDTAAAQAFYDAVGITPYVDVRASDEPADGFRGFALSLVASQPGNVDALVRAALDAGATTLKPAAKSFWGYGAVV
ncbi:glyoxalase, partial [Micromonospora aurantiaca]|nr:glyoxalase [Micromonospora aurantiaca]